MISTDDVLRQVQQAFALAPRPSDEALLHEDCRDDGDIATLYGIPHWQAVPDATVEREYAALFFLSPAGFRHFVPAYLSWALRHPNSGAAVVDATVRALTPASDELRAFSLSKFTLLDEPQRRSILAFLEALVGATGDSAAVAEALAYWRSDLESRA